MGGCFRRLCLRAEHSQDNDVPDFQLLDRSRTLSFRAVKVVFRKLCQKSSNPESDFRLVLELGWIDASPDDINGPCIAMHCSQTE